MKKVYLASLILCPLVIHAETITCPQTITCNYDEGACDVSSNWLLRDSRRYLDDKFPDGQIMKLSSISAAKRSALYYTLNKGYSFRCAYSYGKNSVFLLDQYANDISGSNWKRTGFGKNFAECADLINPDECVGER